MHLENSHKTYRKGSKFLCLEAGHHISHIILCKINALMLHVPRHLCLSCRFGEPLCVAKFSTQSCQNCQVYKTRWVTSYDSFKFVTKFVFEPCHDLIHSVLLVPCLHDYRPWSIKSELWRLWLAQCHVEILDGFNPLNPKLSFGYIILRTAQKR